MNSINYNVLFLNGSILFNNIPLKFKRLKFFHKIYIIFFLSDAGIPHYIYLFIFLTQKRQEEKNYGRVSEKFGTDCRESCTSQIFIND